jgi:hypothetical protein
MIRLIAQSMGPITSGAGTSPSSCGALWVKLCYSNFSGLHIAQDQHPPFLWSVLASMWLSGEL